VAAAAAPAAAPAAPAHTAQELDAARKRLAAAEILFEYDRARLTPEGERSLRQVADDLARYPELRFTIEGHADNRGASTYNNLLGLRRAETVMRFLVKAGIGFERMKLSSGGELRPKVPNKDAKSRAFNRRAVFLPLP
jgi:peptidoglycan-associated lipoprotein